MPISTTDMPATAREEGEVDCPSCEGAGYVIDCGSREMCYRCKGTGTIEAWELDDDEQD